MMKSFLGSSNLEDTSKEEMIDVVQEEEKMDVVQEEEKVEEEMGNDEDIEGEEIEMRVNPKKRKSKKLVDVRKESHNKVVCVRKNCGDCKGMEETKDYWFFDKREEDLVCVGNDCKRSMREYLSLNRTINRDKDKNIMYYCVKVMKEECEIVRCQKCETKMRKIMEANSAGGRVRRQRRPNEPISM